ncbi:bacterioferritin-associated ferredoxin [Alishewanella sp. 16-MA]|uniref:Bacterioferritin-associated ferredoxin n=1 Tax=Alishewanella maricola TaxID=2795740 RepID=A0ABS8C0W5_9ALTE|nr:bacterioferritin-associated ferredoxin [Alishewanella maricola]MCB5225967.1 bacterioferritin-associated ferredoxin [Alishewanella maricola]
MFICVCKAVSDKAIKQAIAEGADSMRSLKNQLGVGSQCGKCLCQASQLLHNELVKQQVSDKVIDSLTKPAA